MPFGTSDPFPWSCCMSYHWNQSLNNKNPFYSPIIYWRKEKQMNNWKGTEKKTTPALPTPTSPPGGWRTFLGILWAHSRAGRSQRVLQQPQGGALSSVWGSIRRRWQAVKGVKTQHRLQPAPLPTQGDWSRKEPGRGSQRITAISPSQWITRITRKTPFISLFLPSEIITQA